MNAAYLDNSATTPVSAAAAEKAMRLMRETFGNADSVHGLGVAAAAELAAARKTVAQALGADPSEMVFTSGGTESNNLAVLGGAAAAGKKGGRVITTAVEHPSVLRAVEQLASRGFETVILPVNGDGVISLSDLEAALDDRTVLLSVMLVNNETGAVQPVAQIRELLRRRQSKALLHTDCVQALGKQPINVRALGADLLSISGHKIHAPKGVGALYVKKGVRLLPQTFGGGQERGLRSGTVAVSQIGALAAAIRELPPVADAHAHARALRRQLLDGLSSYADVAVNSPENGSPFIVNLSVPGVPSEVMIRALESHGVYVSGGSACAKGARSHVLAAQGLSPARIDSAIRISFSHQTAADEITRFLTAFNEAYHTLRRKRS